MKNMCFESYIMDFWFIFSHDQHRIYVYGKQGHNSHKPTFKKLYPSPCTVFASPWWCTGGRQSDLGRLTMSTQGERFFDMHNQRPPTSAAVRKVTFVVVVVFYNALYKGSWPWLSYQLSVCEGQQGGFNYLVKEQRNSTGVLLRGNGWKHQTCNLSAKHALSVNEQRIIPPLCENSNNLTFMFTLT